MSKLWQRVAEAGALVLILSQLGLQPASADVNVEETKRAVVWVDTGWKGTVTVEFKDNTTQTYNASYLGMCSGWIVSNVGHVVTAGHCVRPTANTKVGLIANVIKTEELTINGTPVNPYNVDWKVTFEAPTVRIGQPSVVKDRVFTSELTAQLIDSQDPELGDNALVQVANFDTSGAALMVAATAPAVLDNITSVGFPQDTASITEVDRQDPTFKTGKISSKIVSTKGVPQLQLDGELIGGMSGGPTLNAASEVVGVNSSSFTGSNQSYVTDTNTLRTFLGRNGVTLSANASPTGTSSAVAPNPAPQSSTSSAPSWMWALLGLMGLVVVGVLVVMVVVLRNKQKPQQPQPLAQFPQQPPTQFPGNPQQMQQQPPAGTQQQVRDGRWYPPNQPPTPPAA